MIRRNFIQEVYSYHTERVLKQQTFGGYRENIKILFLVVVELEKVESQQGIGLKKTYFFKTHPACAIDRKGRTQNSAWYC